MLMNMNKHSALLLVSILLASFMIIVLPAKAESRIIVVPDDYPTLSSATANAADGDTIFVRNGTYKENAINTNKSLSIIGESYQSTKIIFFSHYYKVDVNILEQYLFHDPAMVVNADYFKFSGLTLSSDGGDITINGNSAQVTANSIETNFYVNGLYASVTSNVFANFGFHGNYSRISNNVISNGLSINGQYDIVSFNKVTNSGCSIETNDCLI